MKSGWHAGTLLGCFVRSYFVTAAYNPRGLQNIGFMYAMEPGLAALYGPGEGLRQARMRYAGNYNCHPFFTPMLLGILLRLELSIVDHRIDPAVLVSLKDTTANTLSAIGDSFFNGTLLGTWALGACCFVLADYPEAALVFTLQCFVLLQIFKLATFIMGFHKGMAILNFMRRLDLINRSEQVKYLNAVLLGLFLWLALPSAPVLAWAGVASYLLVAGWIVGRCHVPRIFIALLLLATMVGLHVSGLFGHIPSLLFYL